MPGTIVLQGGGAFTANDDLDRRLFADIDRVVLLPTAEAFEQPANLIAKAVEWGERIGVTVETLPVYNRADANEEAAAIVEAAPAVFLAGDSSIHLRSVLAQTPLFAALDAVLEQGGLVVGCGAAAAALCDPMTDQRGGGFALGLGLVAGVAVITSSDTWPNDMLDRTHQLANTPVVDLPTGSALINTAVNNTSKGWELVGDPVVHGTLP